MIPCRSHRLTSSQSPAHSASKQFTLPLGSAAILAMSTGCLDGRLSQGVPTRIFELVLVVHGLHKSSRLKPARQLAPSNCEGTRGAERADLKRETVSRFLRMLSSCPYSAAPVNPFREHLARGERGYGEVGGMLRGS